MSTTLLIVVKVSNGYTSNSAQVSVTSQMVRFNSTYEATRAEQEVQEAYREVSNMRVYTTILEGTA